DYVTQDNLGAVLKRDGAAGLDATGTYFSDVFIRGNLDATASFSGAMAELASGAAIIRAAKLSKLRTKRSATSETSSLSESGTKAGGVPNNAPSGFTQLSSQSRRYLNDLEAQTGF